MLPILFPLVCIQHCKIIFLGVRWKTFKFDQKNQFHRLQKLSMESKWKKSKSCLILCMESMKIGYCLLVLFLYFYILTKTTFSSQHCNPFQVMISRSKNIDLHNWYNDICQVLKRKTLCSCFLHTEKRTKKKVCKNNSSSIENKQPLFHDEKLKNKRGLGEKRRKSRNTN